jgi:hypothetical protein
MGAESLWFMMRLRAAFAVIISLFVHSVALAQEPTPPPRDTTRVPAADTTLAQQPVFQDSVRPIPQLVQHFFAPALGLSDGVWEWDQSAFLLESSTTLSDLLERIPSIATIRTGLLVQPEAAAAFGGTANRLEVFVDGYQLDPLLESSIDLSKIELVHFAHVRIERRIGLIRIYIQTIAAADSRPHTRIEAGIGEPESNLFRGILLAPKLFFGPFGVAIDRMDTDGFNRREPADQFAGWIKWAYIRGKSGLQVQYRRNSTDRDDDIPWPAEHTRDDVIALLRINIHDGLVAELFGGRSTMEVDTVDLSEEEDTIPKINESSTQFGGQVSFSTPLVWARGSVRFRNAEALPSMQFDGSAGVRIGAIASVSADVTQADWSEGGAATWYSLNAQVIPISLLRIFAEYTGGQRGAPYIYGINNPRAFISEQSGYRAGAEVTWRGIQVGAALLHTETDSSAVFGLPFDTTRERTFGSIDADGWELTASVPLFLRGLTGYAMVTNWLSGSLGVYMPSRLYRAGAQIHISPLRSGNLEVYGRMEAVHRGTMFIPDATLPADNTIDAYVQIRIIDVRLFGRFEDIVGQNATEVTGRTILGPRIFYGVKWQFWN